ncbi:MAG: phosphoribosylformylglycinamidine cyclo-ligase [Deltaproteobacteria bacterium]|nr:phosphoribosylformylglycinamidine cyclo-ligase [Deltaproteobacteria bacterium]MCL5792461.1 phosphoribosylformylglycinamidine cyclo-ligase [Deltaproteobacteria bacterium]
MKYSEAGVNVDKGNAFVDRLKSLTSTTMRKGIIGGIGGFAGLFEYDKKRYKRPVFVTSTDGVGTKLKIAFMMDVHDTVGIDLVAMNVNDVIVNGAEPLVFLDYISTSRLKLNVAENIIKGIVKGCKQANCTLIGGETAEMPGFYAKDEYDLAGFVVGVVDRNRLITGGTVKAGDVLIGVGSNGLHSNGYSLARYVLLEKKKIKFNAYIDELGSTLGEELLKPTKIYVKTVLSLADNNLIKAASHITGGGIIDNLPRVFPDNLMAVIRTDSWQIPPIFDMIKYLGNISDVEMLRTFNNGIGMILIVAEKNIDKVVNLLKRKHENAYLIGVMKPLLNGKDRVMFV